jgi:hypothetical protein
MLGRDAVTYNSDGALWIGIYERAREGARTLAHRSWGSAVTGGG